MTVPGKQSCQRDLRGGRDDVARHRELDQLRSRAAHDSTVDEGRECSGQEIACRGIYHRVGCRVSPSRGLEHRHERLEFVPLDRSHLGGHFATL
jgi:hypothetical protein